MKIGESDGGIKWTGSWNKDLFALAIMGTKSGERIRKKNRVDWPRGVIVETTSVLENVPSIEMTVLCDISKLFPLRNFLDLVWKRVRLKWWTNVDGLANYCRYGRIVKPRSRRVFIVVVLGGAGINRMELTVLAGVQTSVMICFFGGCVKQSSVRRHSSHFFQLQDRIVCFLLHVIWITYVIWELILLWLVSSSNYNCEFCSTVLYTWCFWGFFPIFYC